MSIAIQLVAIVLMFGTATVATFAISNGIYKYIPLHATLFAVQLAIFIVVWRH